MRGWGKWIGLLIGYTFFGFFGALIGFAVGAMFDSRSKFEWDESFTGENYFNASHAYQQSRTGDFASSLLVLTAAVMKADGRVLKTELEYVKQFYSRQFGEEKTKALIFTLRDILKQPLQTREIAHQIRYQMQYHSRLQLLHYLFGIADADKNITEAELRVIGQIAGYLGVSQADLASIKAMFIRQTDSDYKILEIEQSVSDEEVKKAYRAMAKKYHPDKVSHLGPEVKKQAEGKFRMVQEAYENIKKARGLS
jgi:DnaJ like chaperone protein